MPSAMYPLYGLSVTGEPPVAASQGEMEMALDDNALLKNAMERMITPDIAPDLGRDVPGPGNEPDQDFRNSPSPSPGFKR